MLKKFRMAALMLAAVPTLTACGAHRNVATTVEVKNPRGEHLYTPGEKPVVVAVRQPGDLLNRENTMFFGQPVPENKLLEAEIETLAQSLSLLENLQGFTQLGVNLNVGNDEDINVSADSYSNAGAVAGVQQEFHNHETKRPGKKPCGAKCEKPVYGE